jgi:hypothetical protein
MEREIDVSAVVRAAPARVRKVFIDDPGSAVSERCSAEQRRSREFHAELTAELGSGASLHQEILIQLGAPQLLDSVLVIPMRWRAIERERLFPAFEGELEVSAQKSPGTRIRLIGSYTVPLGPLGQVGEGIGGHRVAIQSLARYVHEIARRVEIEVDGRVTSVPQRDVESPPDRSEHYIG